MSQFYIDQSVAPPPIPPTVPTSFVTDVNSPAIPSANVLNEIGGSTTANNANGIRTDGSSGSNTLTVQLTNRLTGTATTAGAVNGDVITFSLGATPAAFKFSIELIGYNTATPAAGGYAINATARTTGVAATIVSTPDGDEDEDTAFVSADWDVVSSGNNIIVRVLGVAGLTINWLSVAKYIQVS